MIAGLVAFVPKAHGFGLTGGGGEVGVADPDGRVDGAAEFGAHLEFEDPGTKVHLKPNVNYWNEDGMSDFNPNFDVTYHFRPAKKVSPYAGAGLGVHAYDFDGPDDDETDLGANLIGGVTFPGESANFFVEGRYVASDISQVGVAGGVTIR
jgi:hypothetical protein